MTTQAEAGIHLGITDRAVRDLLDKFGMPRKGFDLDELRLAYLHDLRETAAGRSPEDADYDLTEERARLAYHQANLAEIDEQMKRGDVVPADAVQRAWDELVTRFRARILSIPTKTSHEFIPLTTMGPIQDTLKRYLWEALEELSKYEPSNAAAPAEESGEPGGPAS